MNYKEVSILASDSELREILIALLSEEGYEGFEERDSALVAYIPSSSFVEDVLKEAMERFEVSYSINEIARINWNKKWEENFDPVIVDDFCTVRAHFHDLEVTTTYEVVITPKMSFGTGHHATTQLMIELMRTIDFHDRSVLDFGTGTGILSILASKMGAGKIVGIDNEEWAVENAIENVERNKVQNVQVQLGSLDMVGGQYFDIILANINRHILLQYMNLLYQNCNPGADLLLSGLLAEDRDTVLVAAGEEGFRLESEGVKSNWIVLRLRRLED